MCFDHSLVNFRSSGFVILAENFEVPQGAVFTVDLGPCTVPPAIMPNASPSSKLIESEEGVK